MAVAASAAFSGAGAGAGATAASLESRSLTQWPAAASLPAGCASLSLARNALRTLGAVPPQCRSLDLEGNLVSAAAPGADLGGLLSLSLARNRVVSLRALALASAHRLVQLDLRDNFVASFFPADEAAAAPPSSSSSSSPSPSPSPSSSSGLAMPSLRYLNLSGNCLTGFAAREGALPGCSCST